MRLLWLMGIVVLVTGLTTSSALGEKIVVENEHYAAIKPSVALRADGQASGGKCIEVPLRRPHATTETGPADDGNAYYKLNIPSDGTYQFWGRCWWYDSCGNSFFVLVDTANVTSSTPMVTDQTFRKWHWVAGPVLHLSKGLHSIRIRYREDGARMDQFLLTTSPKTRWKPVRVEKETPQYIVR